MMPLNGAISTSSHQSQFTSPANIILQCIHNCLLMTLQISQKVFKGSQYLILRICSQIYYNLEWQLYLNVIMVTSSLHTVHNLHQQGMDGQINGWTEQSIPISFNFCWWRIRQINTNVLKYLFIWKYWLI